MTGLILKAEPIGEYDRRVVILTKERGKIAAFARGARKQNNRFMASTNPFSFGEFRLYAGRSSYTLAETFISNYFEGLRSDYEGAYYGMYFLEVCDYCTRENNDERELLKLLYQSLRALCAKSLAHELVRYIFEIKTVAINGEFPGIPNGDKLLESTLYAVSYIRRLKSSTHLRSRPRSFRNWAGWPLIIADNRWMETLKAWRYSKAFDKFWLKIRDRSDIMFRIWQTYGKGWEQV